MCVRPSPLLRLCTLHTSFCDFWSQVHTQTGKGLLLLQVWLKSHSTYHARENSTLDLAEQLTWLQACHMRPNPNRNHLWYFNSIKSKLNSALYLTHIQHQFPWPTSSPLLSAFQDWESWKNKLHSAKPHGWRCQLKCYPALRAGDGDGVWNRTVCFPDLMQSSSYSACSFDCKGRLPALTAYGCCLWY